MAAIVLSMIECMESMMEVSMGEAKRRKALGLGSVKSEQWRKTWNESSFLGNVQNLMSKDSETFAGGLTFDEGFSFFREILKRAETLNEWAEKRKHIAKLIRSAMDVTVIGANPSDEVMNFIADARGDRPIAFLDKRPREFDAFLKRRRISQ
jgi:hypothetical protein